MAGNPPGARQGRGETWRRGAGWGSVLSGGRLLAGLQQETLGSSFLPFLVALGVELGYLFGFFLFL